MGALFSASRSFVPERDLQVLTGKVIIVTGGNTGIGFETVRALARRGAKVYLAARNESKATGAIARLEHEGLGTLGGRVLWLKLDLDDPRLAVESARTFLQSEQRLDVLVHNAAQMKGGPEKSKDGILQSMVINHVSPFAFTNALLPLLIKTSQEPGSDVRVVTLASNAHRMSAAINPKVHFSTMEDLNLECKDNAIPWFARYSLSKLANVLSSRGLQKRLNEDNIPITSIAVHPGAVNTFSSRLPFPAFFDIVLQPFFEKPEVGAYTSCIAVASPLVRERPEVYKGAYLVPFGRLDPYTGNGARDDLMEELWALTEHVLQEAGVELVNWRLTPDTDAQTS